MSETLVDSYASLWCLQKWNSTLVDISYTIATKSVQVDGNGELWRYHHLRKQTCFSCLTVVESK